VKNPIPIYKQERELGIADAILANASITYASLAQPFPELLESRTPKVEALFSKASNIPQFDLHPLKSILVTTGWNLNDDVFDRREVYAARYTPEDKPFNYEHVFTDIIGHITDNFLADDDGKIYAADAALDDLPETFHVLVGSVLYKYWDGNEELQARMDKIISELAEGKWFVSMEAHFFDFDYAVINADGSHEVITRSKETAHLTKSLRAYGGTGKFDDKKIGRLVRKIIFAGKGLVARPANPNSIIFASTQKFNPGSVYIPIVKKEKINMSVELQAQIDALKASYKEAVEDNKKLQANLNELTTKATAEKIAELEKLAQAKDAVAAELKAKLEAAEKSQGEVETKLAETVASLKVATEALAQLKAQETKANRIATLATKLGASKEDADITNMVASLSGLSDEAFASFVETAGKKYTEGKTAPTPEAQALEAMEKKPQEAPLTPAPVAKPSVKDQISQAFTKKR
jgi:hypothetical protein